VNSTSDNVVCLIKYNYRYMCINTRDIYINKYERYYGPGRHLLAYLLYYMPTVSSAGA